MLLIFVVFCLCHSIRKTSLVFHPCFFFWYFLGKISLIRLRNPWGKDEWKGAWSDGSKEWEYLPDDVKNDKIDGEFFIALDDFLRVSNHTISVFVKSC